MSATASPSTGKAYGVARVCRVWEMSRATVYRLRQAPKAHLRRGPLGPMADEGLVEAIRDVLTGGFHGEGYRKVWARLRFAGIRTSPRRVLRLLRLAGLVPRIADDVLALGDLLDDPAGGLALYGAALRGLAGAAVGGR